MSPFLRHLVDAMFGLEVGIDVRAASPRSAPQ